MKKIVAFIFLVVSIFYCNFAEAESIIGGELEVERSIRTISIVFIPDNPEHVNASYTRFIFGSQNGTGTLRVARRDLEPIVININSNGNIERVSVGFDSYSCGQGNNELVCAPARAILSVWTFRLSIGRRVEEALRIPPFDFGSYLPPYPEQ